MVIMKRTVIIKMMTIMEKISRLSLSIIVGSIIAIIAMIIAIVIKNEFGNVYESEGMAVREKNEEMPDPQYSITSDSFEYDGKKYSYNKNLNNYLFLGIDKKELINTRKGNADAGQADAIYLFSIDRITKKTTLISIPRDSITMIGKYTIDTRRLLYEEDHLSTAYGYGDGKHLSAQLIKEATSHLLYGMPIMYYCAYELNVLPVISENIGEIEIVNPNDSLMFFDKKYKKNERITIDKNNIEVFLRNRDIKEDNTAIDRMNRQRVFLDALISSIQEKYNNNPKELTNLYTDMIPHMCTNMNSDQFLYLLETIADKEEINEWVVPGDAVVTDIYDEYHINNRELLTKLIENCCTEIE